MSVSCVEYFKMFALFFEKTCLLKVFWYETGFLFNEYQILTVKNEENINNEQFCKLKNVDVKILNEKLKSLKKAVVEYLIKSRITCYSSRFSWLLQYLYCGI